jgi:hypothetical protein
MNPLFLSIGSIAVATSLASCDRNPPRSSNNSEYREGKSGATSSTIQDDTTDNPTPYPAAKKEGDE